MGQPLQRVQCRAGAQLGELPAAHHLQQLHGEFDLADAAARELDIVGALGMPGAAPGRVLANPPVQHAQRVKHAVIQIASEHKGQHHAAQRLGRTAVHAGAWRHDAALEPSEAFPFTTLHLKVFFQCAQRYGRRAGIAVGPQGQINTEHKAVLGNVANQPVNVPDRLGKVIVVGNAAAP